MRSMVEGKRCRRLFRPEVPAFAGMTDSVYFVTPAKAGVSGR